jgi:hypothetical protein
VGKARIVSKTTATCPSGLAAASERHCGRRSRARRALSASRSALPAQARGAAGRLVAEPGVTRPEIAAGGLPGESLNWSLRRYVRGWSLRVWLRRRALVMARATRPARAIVAGERPHGAVATAGCPAVTGQRANRLYRNGQMEHSAQVATGRRGGGRCGPAVRPTARDGARDLLMTTLGSKVVMESNIFRLVMT